METIGCFHEGMKSTAAEQCERNTLCFECAKMPDYVLSAQTIDMIDSSVGHLVMQ